MQIPAARPVLRKNIFMPIGWLVGKTVCSQGSVMPVGGKMRLLWHDPELLWFKVGVSSNNSVSNMSVRLVVQMLAPGMPRPYAN